MSCKYGYQHLSDQWTTLTTASNEAISWDMIWLAGTEKLMQIFADYGEDFDIVAFRNVDPPSQSRTTNSNCIKDDMWRLFYAMATTDEYDRDQWRQWSIPDGSPSVEFLNWSKSVDDYLSKNHPQMYAHIFAKFMTTYYRSESSGLTKDQRYNEAFTMINGLQKDEIPERFPTQWREARNIATSYGMWGVVTKSFCKELADKIKGKRVLEVMAGRGWLAKGLREQDVSITTTDSYLSQYGSDANHVTEVINLDAVKAVEQMGADHDVLLISWAPYYERTVLDVIKKWGSGRDIIYIGQDEMGMTGHPDVFTLFESEDRVSTDAWFGAFDDCYIGKTT